MNVKNEYSNWRVSSTMFAHLHNSSTLQPIEEFLNENTCKIYPTINKGKWLINELNKISLN